MPGPDMLAHVAALLECRDVDTAWQLHVDCMARFGFDRMIYGLTRFPPGATLADLSDVLILSNHTPEYLTPWLRDGFVSHSPMVRWALHNTGACSWRWITEEDARGTLTEAERRTVAFNQRMGVRAGYTISFGQKGTRHRGVIGLCARDGLQQDEVDAYWQIVGREVEVLNGLMHLCISALPHTPPARHLTARQREVLEWVSEGKTTQDIATILGVTPATVEKHLRLARTTMGAETTAQALLRASFFNQIYQVSPR